MSKDQYNLTANIQQVIHVLDTPAGNGGTDDEQDDREEREIIHVYPVEGGGVLFTRTPIEEDEDTAPIYTQPPKNAPTPITPQTIGVLFLSILIPLSCIIFQLYILFNPPVATLTIIPRSQQINLTGTLQLGRVLSPITISQEAETQATGKGHQDPRQAQGSITFYNGQLSPQFVPAGTILTGSSGTQIITDQDANIPAADPTANPPIFGYVTVSAHAVHPGSAGNIQALDINQPCCSSVVAKNLSNFTGGQDTRDFQIVAKRDIDTTAATLKTTVVQSMQAALQAQLKTNESLIAQPCTPTVTPSNRIGQEATTVKVTESETCSAVAYNSQQLENSVTQLLTTQAEGKLGTGYSLLGNPDITVTTASAQNKKVVVSFNAQGLWVYALSNEAQEHIKQLIAGKTKENALQLLKNLPGIERVSMQFSGFGEDSKVPKNVQYIHLVILAGI